jgi:hypothetical protein
VLCRTASFVLQALAIVGAKSLEVRGVADGKHGVASKEHVRSCAASGRRSNAAERPVDVRQCVRGREWGVVQPGPRQTYMK